MKKKLLLDPEYFQAFKTFYREEKAIYCIFLLNPFSHLLEPDSRSDDESRAKSSGCLEGLKVFKSTRINLKID